MKKQSNTSPKVPGAKIMVMDDLLSNLFMLSGDFTALTERVVFRFFSDSPKLTLHGWSSNTDVFEDEADVKLQIGQSSSFKFGNKTYFGNLVLSPKHIKKIIKMIGTKKYVVFTPLDPQAPTQNQQITYNIQVTDDDPTFDASMTATGVSLNPSPPRNSG